MKQKTISLLENILEEIVVVVLATSCAITQINPREILQNYSRKSEMNYSLPEFKQGKVSGVSAGDEFLLEERVFPKQELKYLTDNEINNYLNGFYRQMNLPEYISRDYVKALIKQESSNNPEAISSWGARGLLQILEKTWYDYGEIPYDEAFNPERNIYVGLKHLKWIDSYCEKKYPNYFELSNQEKQDVISAIHNVGIGKFERRNWDISKMPKETRKHVERIREKLNSI